MKDVNTNTKTQLTVAGNGGCLEIAGIKVYLWRSTNEEYMRRGEIGYGEGPRNMGTTLYSKESIRFLLEDALGIPKPSSKAIEQIYNWLKDYKLVDKDVFVFD